MRPASDGPPARRERRGPPAARARAFRSARSRRTIASSSGPRLRTRTRTLSHAPEPVSRESPRATRDEDARRGGLEIHPTAQLCSQTPSGNGAPHRRPATLALRLRLRPRHARARACPRARSWSIDACTQSRSRRRLERVARRARRERPGRAERPAERSPDAVADLDLESTRIDRREHRATLDGERAAETCARDRRAPSRSSSVAARHEFACAISTVRRTSTESTPIDLVHGTSRASRVGIPAISLTSRCRCVSMTRSSQCTRSKRRVLLDACARIVVVEGRRRVAMHENRVRAHVHAPRRGRGGPRSASTRSGDDERVGRRCSSTRLRGMMNRTGGRSPRPARVRHVTVPASIVSFSWWQGCGPRLGSSQRSRPSPLVIRASLVIERSRPG